MTKKSSKPVAKKPAEKRPTRVQLVNEELNGGLLELPDGKLVESGEKFWVDEVLASQMLKDPQVRVALA